MFQVLGIKKSYNNGGNIINALKGINIAFPSTGMVFILGKSGAGKSTLLNILGGLDKADEGNIIINGMATSQFKSKDFDAYRNYQVGFIFQEFNLIDDISVKDNIALALKIQAKGHDATTIDEALKMVNLEGLGYRSPKELSGGQKQRIAVARALVKNPSIILADEPTGALDSKTSYELLSSLKVLSKEKLVIVATHDEEFPFIFGDEIIHIEDGCVVEHLIPNNNYKITANNKISNNIIKITSGEKINSKDLVNSLLNNESTNYVCLSESPEMLTLAYPDDYQKVFEQINYKEKFIKLDKEKFIDEKKEIRKEHKAGISLNECLKMALHQFNKAKGKIIFLLVFIILSFSILGFSYLLSSVDNSSIIANTLANNNMNLAIMEKNNNDGKMILKNSDIDSLNENYKKTNFAIGKEIEISYTKGIRSVSSSFEMVSFKGIVEVDDINKLNLNILAGSASFNEDSIKNHEIIISDYAAYELRRTGYVGSDIDGNYGLNKPATMEQQIGTTILIENYEYKIIGIFDTNFEDYLSLLVSETYVDNESMQVNSLNALKSYYFARIFGPVGFYSNFIDENNIYSSSNLFRLDINDVPVYSYNSETEELINDYSLASLTYANFSKFVPFSSVDENEFTIETVYGQIPSELKENEVILSYDWLANKGITTTSQIEKALEQINKACVIKKMKEDGSVDTYLYSGEIKVVAIVNITPINASSISFSYSSTFMYFSNEYANEFTSSLYGYDQILFTLNGNRYNFKNSIKKFENLNYNVINIDGSKFSSSDIEAIKSASLIISVIMILFAFLIMMNYVNSNVKNREKEIGILRACGAKGIDVIKIFAIEEGILALITSFLSLIIISYVSTFLNGILGNNDLSIEIIHFDLLHSLVIIIATLAFFLLTTLIPVMKIAIKKPIEAIRNI